MLQNPHVLLTLEKVHNPLRLPRETTSEPPKVVRAWCVLCILTWKCASRHNGLHFFDISIPKVVRACCVLYILTSKLRKAGARSALFLSHVCISVILAQGPCYERSLKLHANPTGSDIEKNQYLVQNQYF